MKEKMEIEREGERERKNYFGLSLILCLSQAPPILPFSIPICVCSAGWLVWRGEEGGRGGVRKKNRGE